MEKKNSEKSKKISLKNREKILGIIEKKFLEN